MTSFALDHKGSVMYLLGIWTDPLRQCQLIWCCLLLQWMALEMQLSCLFSRCSMSTEDGAKLYDVCPHVSDSVSFWFS